MGNFHTKSIETVLNEIHSSKNGLSSKEAQLRLQTNGTNTLSSPKKPNYFLKFLKQFKDIFVIILVCASIVSLIFGIIEQSKTELIDSIIIFVIVLLNATLGFTQEIKAENALESLKKMAQPYAKVLRDNQQISVKTSDIVVGDIVLLEAGDVVPADILLIDSISLKCDESMLTGESIAVEKTANIILNDKTVLGDRKNMCFSSTIVEYGKGTGVVVATGKQAEIGKIANMLIDDKKDKTPLQNSLNKLGEIITFIVLGIAIAIFLVDVIFVHIGYVESFLTAVAIAVAAIPESLPAVVTIILSLGVVKLAKKNAIIKKLHAVETLGCCEVICSDKTGTITQNKMTVKQVAFCDKGFVDRLDLSKENQQFLLKCMFLCNDAKYTKESNFGDATELALLKYVYDNYPNQKIYYPRINEKPFDSSRKLMSTINNCDSQVIQFTKGACDELLKKCDYVYDGNKIRSITLSDKQKIQEQNAKMGRGALRVLGFAIKFFDINISNKIEVDENALVFVGLCGMIDPPKKEVYDAIKKCKKAGMRAVMITGDHKDTATAIALELDIIKSPKEVVNGNYLDQFSDEQLKKEITKYSVFCRVSPEHKVRIVKAYKALGKVVAMTGDGVNDAPSIKCADIGIGMGKTGTDVTKDVANMLLADDNFATIVVAVEEGRRIFDNIQKTIQFLLGCNIAEVLAIFAITLAFPTHPFLSAVQILFINLVTDTLPSIALGVDNAEKDIMSIPPRNPKKNIIGGRVGFDIVYQGLTQAIIVLLVYMIGFYGFGNYMQATTMAFLTINFIQLFHMYNVHSKKSIFKDNPFKNKVINFSFVFEILIFFVFAFCSPLAKLLNMAPLSLIQWLIVFAFSILIIPICELVKLMETK